MHLKWACLWMSVEVGSEKIQGQARFVLNNPSYFGKDRISNQYLDLRKCRYFSSLRRNSSKLKYRRDEMHVRIQSIRSIPPQVTSFTNVHAHVPLLKLRLYNSLDVSIGGIIAVSSLACMLPNLDHLGGLFADTFGLDCEILVKYLVKYGQGKQADTTLKCTWWYNFSMPGRPIKVIRWVSLVLITSTCRRRDHQIREAMDLRPAVVSPEVRSLLITEP